MPAAVPPAKRVFDLVVTSLGLLVAGPAMALVALLVRLRLGTPVLFVQVRPGLHAQPFRLYKFRTMTRERDEHGRLLPDAQRLTPFGAWLRSTSLDELPELVNVLRGDMSLVGPRPLLMEYVGRYSPRQARRHEVLPGITGWAQIHGRNAATWEERLELDVWYVDNRSLWLDVKILLTTLWRVLRREGITARGHATAPRFEGPDEGGDGAGA